MGAVALLALGLAWGTVEELPVEQVDPPLRPVPDETFEEPEARAPAVPFDPDRIRAPLVALQGVRFERARRAAAVQLAVGGGGVLAGGAIGLTAPRGEARAAGGTLALGSLAQGASAWLQLDLAQRRHAAFLSHLAAIEGRGPDAFHGLLTDTRLSVEREARAHAFGAGLYGALAGLGVLTVVAAAGPRDVDQASVALTLVGVSGTLHHAARWRASARVAGDLATLQEQVRRP